MSVTNDVRLLIGGREYGGWKSVRIEAGVERLARSFELSVTSSWPGQGGLPLQSLPVAQGDRCEVFIGADRVMTGYIDAMPIGYDGDGVYLSVRGRSLTADLVDCSAVNSPGQWRGMKLEAIAAALAAPYGIDVVTEVATGAVIADHQIQVGETVFESLDRMMRLRQVLACDDATGRVLITAPGQSGDASTAIELGANVMEASATRDHSGLYSEYICKGQRAGDDDLFGEAVSEISSTATQSGMSRRRVLIIKQSGQADAAACLDRAEYERDHRMGQAREVLYTIGGWRQGDGSLWRVNQSVRVVDRMLAINESWVVAELAYVLDERGMRTQLRVLPASALTTRPAEQAKATSRGGASGDTWADVK